MDTVNHKMLGFLRLPKLPGFSLAYFTAALFSFSFSCAAQADYLAYHFKLICNPQNNRAEIVPYAIWNESFDGPTTQECVIPKGRHIRTKMGTGPAYPYGFGRGDPERWLSVWLDKTLVLSGRQIICNDEGLCSPRIIVTAKGLEVCYRTTPETSQPQNSTNQPDERCEFTPNEKISKKRDPLEYPLPNERKRPKAGSLATLYAKDKKFCNKFKLVSEVNYRSYASDNISAPIGLPREAEPIEPDSTSPYEWSGKYKHYTFDINNDQINESVVGLHSRTHYRDGDAYFVYQDSNVPSPEVDSRGSTESELVYAAAAKKIIPHYWSVYHLGDEWQLSKFDNSVGDYAVKSVSAPWWDSGDEPRFMFRYWYLQPFRYQHTTYFLTWSQQADKLHWYTVLRPEANYLVTEMCIFQVVKERY